MNIRSASSCVVFALVLASCAAMGVAATSDPRQKLQDAEVLFMFKDRPLPAEALILEAIQIFQQRQDWHWLGHAYREYGDLLRSEAVTRRERIYRRDGFRDKSITFDNHLEKSADFYRKALESYGKAETKDTEANQYDALTNLYLNMGLSHHKLGENDSACSYYQKMMEAADKNRELHPSMAPPQEEMQKVATDLRKTAGCVQSLPDNSLEQ